MSMIIIRSVMFRKKGNWLAIKRGADLNNNKPNQPVAMVNGG